MQGGVGIKCSNDRKSAMSGSGIDNNEKTIVERSNELSEIIAKYKKSLNNRISTNHSLNREDQLHVWKSQKSAALPSPSRYNDY
jgi:hypothetical protein